MEDLLEYFQDRSYRQQEELVVTQNQLQQTQEELTRTQQELGIKASDHPPYLSSNIGKAQGFSESDRRGL